MTLEQLREAAPDLTIEDAQGHFVVRKGDSAPFCITKDAPSVYEKMTPEDHQKFIDTTIAMARDTMGW